MICLIVIIKLNLLEFNIFSLLIKDNIIIHSIFLIYKKIDFKLTQN